MRSPFWLVNNNVCEKCAEVSIIDNISGAYINNTIMHPMEKCANLWGNFSDNIRNQGCYVLVK